MADTKKLLDVWIVESNTFYRDVPFSVVADWIQQGRLLDNDMLSLPGAQKWAAIQKTKFAAYLPRPEPFEVDDQAEALAPVAFDFSWKPTSDEDDDVDMIPLIDISLVLLVFFMMTTTVVISSTAINVPQTKHGSFFSPSGAIWIGISPTPDGPPVFSIGQGETPPADADQKLSEAQVVARLATLVDQQSEPVELRIAADRALPGEVVMRLTGHAEKLKRAGKIRTIRGEVKEQTQ